MQVLAVASEIYPLVKTGGLADVAGALPKALKAEGIETITLVPGYPDVLSALVEADEVLCYCRDFYGGAARVLRGSAAGLQLFVLDAPHLFARPGNPYVAPDGADWPDNAIRYAALGRTAAEIGQGSIAQFVPQVVHAHDWQAGLTPRVFALQRPAAAGHGHDRSQSRLSRPISAGDVARDRIASRILCD